MNTALMEQISNLNDAASVEFLQHFNQMLFNGVTNDFDILLANIPLSIRELPQFSSVESLALGETERKLTEQESIELAKPILEILGRNSDLLPLLEQAWKTWEQYDNTLGEDKPNKLLSAALAASMLVVVASSEVKCNIGGVEFHKHNVLVKDVAELVGQVGKIIYGSPAK